ncbi:hypothetical protein BaRGS_00007339 [Batillaria attramentaria]|uniref:EGF-like domain-containing protein n=1 Tax=Batillaria attramentaria TaxID=370345 RepID=A0ABD0LPX8_9CAEN
MDAVRALFCLWIFTLTHKDRMSHGVMSMMIDEKEIPYSSAFYARSTWSKYAPEPVRDRKMDTCYYKQFCVKEGHFVTAQFYITVSHWVFYFKGGNPVQALNSTKIFTRYGNGRSKPNLQCDPRRITPLVDGGVRFSCFNIEQKRVGTNLCIEPATANEICEIKVLFCPFGATGPICNEKCACMPSLKAIHSWDKLALTKYGVPLYVSTLNLCDTFGRCPYYCWKSDEPADNLDEQKGFTALMNYLNDGTYTSTRPEPQPFCNASVFKVVSDLNFTVGLNTTNFQVTDTENYAISHMSRQLSRNIPIWNSTDFFLYRAIAKVQYVTSGSHIKPPYVIDLYKDIYIYATLFSFEYIHPTPKYIHTIYVHFTYRGTGSEPGPHTVKTAFVDLFQNFQYCAAWSGFAAFWFLNITRTDMQFGPDKMCTRRTQQMRLLFSPTDANLDTVLFITCKDTQYGENCDQKCNCKDPRERCRKLVGLCAKSGCRDGYWGVNCTSRCLHICSVCDWQVGDRDCFRCKNKNMRPPHCNTTNCPFGMWGPMCVRCGMCVGDDCNRNTGACPSGCKRGYQGTRCDEILVQCPVGTYGDGTNCTSCATCARGLCDDNGVCIKGCEPGWTGEKCTVKCPPKTYGQNCSEDCGHCVYDSFHSTCDAGSGTCPSGQCTGGYISPDCRKPCARNSFGINCQSTCGHCANNSICNAQTGDCPLGCAANYVGKDCKDICARCETDSCTHCSGSYTRCLRPNGTCLDGCKPGWLGSQCRLKCPMGTYGENCSEDCGHCVYDDQSPSCNHGNGACPHNKCTSGYQLPDCKKPCPAQSTGINCTEKCGQCAYGSVCSAVTSECPKGCAGNHFGQNCKNTCNPDCKVKSCKTCSGSYRQCLKPNGTCIKGCQPGWFGSQCRMKCPQGTYGESCSEDCGHCVYDSANLTCTAATGACPYNQCTSGYQPPRCKKPCPPQTIGIHCNQSCGHCAHGSICSAKSGECPLGCAEGYSGDDCRDKCLSGCKSVSCQTCQENASKCLKPKGTCLKGCLSGWFGRDCRLKCPKGTYGENCSEDCGHCVYNSTHSTCDSTKGTCPSGQCTGGYLPSDCRKPCARNSFGINCQSTCGHCANNSICNAQTGDCPLGCAANYVGKDCKDICARCETDSCTNCSGSYTRCLHPNGTCSGSYRQCLKPNGTCIKGCQPGWFGSQCRMKCPQGTYGESCSEDCGHCVYNSSGQSCDFVTGVCPGKQCKAGYRLPDCKKVCPPNTYGPDCRTTCGDCANGTSCSAATGDCPMGCAINYRGNDCKYTCDPRCGEENCKNCYGSYAKCLRPNGTCVDGCLPGWFGAQCRSKCPPGTYGPFCSEDCGHCVYDLSDTSCDGVTGACPSAECTGGYKLPDCKKPCPPGSAGANCSHICGRCADGGTCNGKTEECPRGCAAGFNGTRCGDPCPDCFSKSCDKCNSSHFECLLPQASCISGCVEGWKGRDCREPDICFQCQGLLCVPLCSQCIGGRSECQNRKCLKGCNAGFIPPECACSCKPGWHGMHCHYPCGFCAGGAACDPISGICPVPGDCQPGYLSDDCKTRCPDGYFGLNCSCICGHCAGHCNNTDGTCERGVCQPGWTDSPFCNASCPPGTYGQNCSGVCGNCYNGSVCDHVTGACDKCEKGFALPLCVDTCPNGKCGQDCLEICGKCKNDTCDPFNCTCDICRPGYQLPHCYMPCPKGFYGQNCSERCGHCLETDEICMPEDGRCVAGCQPGYANMTCHDECADGYYGLHCSSKCGNCAPPPPNDTLSPHNSTNESKPELEIRPEKGICEKVDGVCPNGCLPGWTGKRCRTGHLSVSQSRMMEGVYDLTQDFLIAGTTVVLIFFFLLISFIMWRWSKGKPSFFDKFDFG